MRRLVSIALPLALAGTLAVAATSSQARAPALTGRVVGAPTGDTLLVRLATGSVARVKVLGVHAPTGSSCYSGESAAAARTLTVGKRVRLLGDPARGAYVALPTGKDLGRALLAEGAVQIDTWRAPFSRLGDYVPLQERAERTAQGMWGACAADIALTMTGPTRAVVGPPVTYTIIVKNVGALGAGHVELELRPGSYAEQLVSVASTTAGCAAKSWMATCTLEDLAAGATASLRLVLRPTSFGVLSARARASVSGCTRAQCGVAPLLDSNPDNDQAAFVTVVPGGAYDGACDPSYPTVCIPPPPPDLDCEDFLPLKRFPVRRDVAVPDPHHLDGDANGVACEEDDY